MERTAPYQPTVHRFTVDQYYQMGEAGILGEDERLELIDGQIIAMSPISSFHASVVNKLTQWLLLQHTGKYQISVQNPLRLNDFSEPEPDLMLVDVAPDFYAQAHPTPAQVQVVIEVADSSLEFDQEVKGKLYAQHAVPEYWVINLPQKQVEIYTRPQHGFYLDKTVRSGTDVVSPDWLPGKTVDDLF